MTQHINEDDLCTRCTSINIDQLFADFDEYPEQGSDPKPVLSVGKLGHELEQAPCSLCRLFYSVKIKTGEDADNSEYQLFSMPPDWFPEDLPFPRSLSVMVQQDEAIPEQLDLSGIANTRFISCSDNEQSKAHQNSDKAGLIDPTSIDFDMIRGWIESSGVENRKSATSPLEWPVNIKVIDCEHRRIVRAGEKWPYCALSYVWGKSSDESQFLAGWLPASLPKTIEDALTVAKLLGYRYIWIDRYCIDQTDSIEKMQQIKQMDLVYKSADLTIVAAAGNDPTVGLPGVSSTPRIAQNSSWKSGYQLVSYPAFPVEDIERSTWMNRAWTLQEAFFSSQKLYFTEQAVFFESSSVRVSEVFKTNFNRYWLHTMLPNSDQDIVGAPELLLRYIGWYSGRKLTYESDTIIAFEGIFNAFRDRPTIESVVHYKGIPLRPEYWKVPRNSEYKTSRRGQRFMSSLSWVIDSWPTKPLAVRRMAFPSWSWAGWEVKVAMQSVWDFELYEAQDNTLQVFAEKLDGTLLDFDNDESFLEMLNFSEQFSNIICVTTSVIPVKILYKSQIAESRYIMTFESFTDPESEFCCFFDDKDFDTHVEANSFRESHDGEISPKAVASEFEGAKTIGIVLGERIEGQSLLTGGDILILIARDVGSHFERVGTALFHIPDSEEKTIPNDAETTLVEIIRRESTRKTIRLG